MQFFLLLSFYLVTCNGRKLDEEWIDPTDMLNYDAAAGRMKHQKPYHTGKTAVNEDSDEQDQGTCLTDNSDCKTDNNKWKQKEGIAVSEKEVNEMKDESVCQKCQEDIDILKEEIQECRKKEETSLSSCNPVFRRFLYRIINEAQLLGLPDESQPEVHYDVELVLTNQIIAEFQRFLKNTDWESGPLDEALGGTLVKFRHHNEEEWSWKFEDYIGTDPFTAFLISLSLLCIVMVVATELWTHIGWFAQIKRLLALSFLVSIVWNWMYLYRDAVAEQQAKLSKMGNDHVCGKQMTWSQSWLEWWKSSSSFQNDPCEEYFKALMINPIFQVPPTKAFAITFTNFITEPLKHIGKGFGEFFHGLLAEMPLFYQPIVLIIIALLLLVFCYGFGTSVHHINRFRRNDGDRERLPPPNPQREGYDRFIEGRDGRFYNNLQPIQPQRVEDHRDGLNPRPEILQPMDGRQIANSQQDVNSFVESISTNEQPQRKQVALKKRANDQHIKDETSGQLQSKRAPLDYEHLGQQRVKEHVGNSPLGSQEEFLKNSKPLDKIHHDLSGSYAKVKENLSPDMETLVNMSQITEEVQIGKSTEEETVQQLMKENELKGNWGNSPVDVITATDDAPGTTFNPDKSHLPNCDLNVEDLYTDPENSQYPSVL